MRLNTTSLALVTGGSSGIGEAIAYHLASEEKQVIIADIKPPSKESEYFIFFKCDVTKGEEVDALFQKVIKKYGIPNALILNAGMGIHEKLLEGDPDKWKEVLDLNLMGALRMIRAFVPPMYSQKQGHVVFISSVSANKVYSYGGVYSASKAALDMIAETLRIETLPHIKVTVVAAGMVKTQFFEKRGGGDPLQEKGAEYLSAESIAADVSYAINKKSPASINNITVRPEGQIF